MNPFEIFIIYLSWGGGGKSRPVLAYLIDGKSVSIYQITSQYGKKSKKVKANYYKINDWAKAGLDKQSYIDIGTLIKLPLSAINGKTIIGKLSENDKQNLIDILEKQ